MSVVNLLHGLVDVAAPTPTPTPAATLNPNSVTPGFIGFLVIFLVAIVVILLMIDMVRRIRRMRYREEIAAKLDAEQAEARENAVPNSGLDAAGSIRVVTRNERGEINPGGKPD